MTKFAQLLSRAIRILRGNRDESARASHLVVNKEQFAYNELLQVGQAEREKFFQSTFFERKIMSTKTAFKRVALVAAAALAIGGVTAVAANAAATDTFTVAAYNGGLASTALTGSATVGTYVSSTITFTGDTNNADSITSTGVGQINVPSVAAATDNVATTGISTVGFTAFEADSSSAVPGTSLHTLSTTTGTFAVVGSLIISAYSATAGTQTITVNGSGGASTLTITWGAAPVVSTQYSFINEQAGTTGSTLTGLYAFTTAGVSNVTASDAVSASAVANIGVLTLSSATAAMNTDTVSASISGPGILGSGTTTAGGAKAGTGISQAETAGVSYFSVYGSGSAGVATITFTDGTTVLGTRTVTFTGNAAKATITQNLFVAQAGAGLGQQTPTGTAQTGATVPLTAAIDVNVADANGNAVNSLPVLTTSASNIITVGTCVQVTATAGLYECPVAGASGAISGTKATVTATVLNPVTSAYDIVTPAVTFTIGGAIANEVLSTDASSYNALSPIVLTLTATDSSGNPAYDQTVTGGLTGTIVSSTQLGGAAFSATSFTTLVNGTSTFKGTYAPAVAGDFTLTGADSVSSAGEAVTVTATSLGGSADASANAATDAANEATDAANAATDAANAAADSADAATQAAQDAGDKADAALAAVTALSQQVTTVLAKVAAISVLLVRIIKKVKA